LVDDYDDAGYDTNKYFIVIIIIITTRFPYFTVVQLFLGTVRVSLTKHNLFTVVPKLSDCTACTEYYSFLY